MSRAVVEQVRIPFVQGAALTLGGVERSVYLVDLGMEGVFIETDERPAIGEPVGVRFRLPGNAIPIEARAAVSWVHVPGSAPRGLPGGIGLHFVELAERDRIRLRDFLDEYCRRGRAGRRFARPWPTAGALGGEA